MDSTLLTLFVDIALGGMAYHLAWKLSGIQEKQTVIIQDHELRLKKLESKES